MNFIHFVKHRFLFIKVKTECIAKIHLQRQISHSVLYGRKPIIINIVFFFLIKNIFYLSIASFFKRNKEIDVINSELEIRCTLDFNKTFVSMYA